MILTRDDKAAIEFGMTHHVKVEGGIGCYVNGMDAVVKAMASYGGAARVVITPIADIARLAESLKKVGRPKIA
jgi:hypothetical protein